jgi:polyferredoxin
MDACDTMMESVGLEKGLVRVVSENGIKNRTKFQWTRRVVSYTAVLVLLVGVLTTMLVTRKDFEAVIVRQRGSTYQMVGNGMVSNIYEINLINKTQSDYDVKLKLEGSVGFIQTVVKKLTLKKEGSLKERFIVEIPLKDIENGKRIIYIRVLGNGKEIQRVKTKFIGPLL